MKLSSLHTNPKAQSHTSVINTNYKINLGSFARDYFSEIFHLKIKNYLRMKKHINLLLILFVFEKSFIAIGYSQNSFTLEQAKNYALKNSFKAKDAQLEVLLANQQIKQIVGSGLPQINANFDYNYFADVPKSPFPSEFFGGEPGTFTPIAIAPIHNFAGTLQGSMVLFDASYFLGLQTAKMYRELSIHRREKSLQEVKEEVTRGYYMCVISKENIKVLEETVVTLENNLRETAALQKNGFLELLDVEQLTLVVANTKNLLERNKNQLLASELLLKFSMGYPIEDEIILSDGIAELENEINQSYLGSTTNLDLNSNIDFQILKQTELLNKKNFQIEKTRSLPSIIMGASYARNAINNDDIIFLNRETSRWFTGGTVVFFSMRVPIFSSLIRDANIKTAKYNYQRVGLQKQLLSESLKISFQNNKSEYEVSLKQYQIEKTNLELAERIRNINRIKFKEGMISSLELSQAENQYLQTRGNYFQALYNLMNAKVEFYKLINKL